MGKIRSVLVCVGGGAGCERFPGSRWRAKAGWLFMSVCSSCWLAILFLEQLEPGSKASELQPALQPALQLPRNYMACKLGNPCEAWTSPQAMAAPLVRMARLTGLWSHLQSQDLSWPTSQARSVCCCRGMPHMGCKMGVSILLQSPYWWRLLCKASLLALLKLSHPWQVVSCTVLHAETGRLPPLASCVLPGPRFHPSCWVTYIWLLPPSGWGKRQNGRNAICLKVEVQKLCDYLHAHPQGTTWPHLASREAIIGWPWAWLKLRGLH